MKPTQILVFTLSILLLVTQAQYTPAQEQTADQTIIEQLSNRLLQLKTVCDNSRTIIGSGILVSSEGDIFTANHNVDMLFSGTAENCVLHIQRGIYSEAEGKATFSEEESTFTVEEIMRPSHLPRTGSGLDVAHLKITTFTAQTESQLQITRFEGETLFALAFNGVTNLVVRPDTPFEFSEASGPFVFTDRVIDAMSGGVFFNSDGRLVGLITENVDNDSIGQASLFSSICSNQLFVNSCKLFDVPDLRAEFKLPATTPNTTEYLTFRITGNVATPVNPFINLQRVDLEFKRDVDNINSSTLRESQLNEGLRSIPCGYEGEAKDVVCNLDNTVYSQILFDLLPLASSEPDNFPSTMRFSVQWLGHDVNPFEIRVETACNFESINETDWITQTNTNDESKLNDYWKSIRTGACHFEDDPILSQMVIVPKGSFRIGVTQDEYKSLRDSLIGNDIDPKYLCTWAASEQVGEIDKCDTPKVFRLTLPTYFIDTTEITWEEYGYLKEDVQLPAGESMSDPAIVSFQDAKNFCETRGMYLPYEEEWEYAARGPSNWLYTWSPEYSTFEEDVSWVGAVNMIDGTAEMVNQQVSDDGSANLTPRYRPIYSREFLEERDSFSRTSFVVRGGFPHGDNGPIDRSAVFRYRNSKNNKTAGFRCVKRMESDYVPESPICSLTRVIGDIDALYAFDDTPLVAIKVDKGEWMQGVQIHYTNDRSAGGDPNIYLDSIYPLYNYDNISSEEGKFPRYGANYALSKKVSDSQLANKDGHPTPGTGAQFTLNEGEFITGVKIWTDWKPEQRGFILGIQFYTNMNRISKEFKDVSSELNLNDFDSYEFLSPDENKCMLAGFHGEAGPWLYGLGVIWAPIPESK